MSQIIKRIKVNVDDMIKVTKGEIRIDKPQEYSIRKSRTINQMGFEEPMVIIEVICN